MTTTNITTTTAGKKVIKDSTYKYTPETINFSMNSFTHRSLTIQVKFHEVAKYIILYGELKLLKPFRSIIENKNNFRLRTT